MDLILGIHMYPTMCEKQVAYCVVGQTPSTSAVCSVDINQRFQCTVSIRCQPGFVELLQSISVSIHQAS